MKNTVKTTALAVVLTALPLVAQAEPPAWIVSDEDSRIVLFPTVHALPDGLDWKSDALSDVINTSDEVWLEIANANDPGAQAEIQQLVAAHGMSPDLTLSQRLTADQFAALETAATKLGLPAASLEPLQPWLAGLVLTQTELATAGISGERGVESVLIEDFGDRPVRGFETMEEQTLMLATLDMDTQISFLMTAVETTGTTAARLTEIAEDWAEGDVSGMETELLAEMRAEFPGLFDIIFTDRNAVWTDVIIAELDGTGTDFMAVGAGHLIGEDSVPDMLRDRGYEVSQVTLSDAEF